MDPAIEQPIDIRQHRHIIINAKSASAGDAFLSLDARPPINEIQYKLYTGDSDTNQKEYVAERQKSASRQDFFMFFTTQKKPCNIKLPVNSGIVDRKNWDDYFGPFAGRAFVYGVKRFPNINKASFMVLQLVNGVGPVTAKKILEKRPFLNLDDATQKTNIKRRILETYRF